VFVQIPFQLLVIFKCASISSSVFPCFGQPPIEKESADQAIEAYFERLARANDIGPFKHGWDLEICVYGCARYRAGQTRFRR
jgi:hypothetical protein